MRRSGAKERRLRIHGRVHVWYPSVMVIRPHDVLATREARAQLPAMLERFRRAGSDAEPVVIGARRKPEAVVLSYERYLELAGGREKVQAALERQAETIGRELSEEEAMKLANEALHEVRRNRDASCR